MRRLLRLSALVALSAWPPPAPAGPAVADIYWIDVEGGAATLVVAGGKAVLMDTGYDGFDDRDPRRIEAVLEQAGVERIDYLVTSHFHRDHVGGLASLARRIEIGQFLDHGDSVEKERERGRALWTSYLETVQGRRRVVEPGDSLPLEGASLVFVASHSRFVTEPLGDSGPNRLCESFEPHPEDEGENGKSLGYLFAVGEFQFLNLGDLSWNFQKELACPRNLLGEVDLFQVTHHGVRDDVLPQQMWAVAPAVAVVNNGPRKGAGAVAMETVMASPGLEDVWQVHRAVENDDAHNTSERLIANLGDSEACDAHWIHARVESDGSYTLTNGRNGFSRTYQAR